MDDSSQPDTFSRMLSVPEVTDVIRKVASRRLVNRHHVPEDEAMAEVAVAVQQRLLGDGWLPRVYDLESFCTALFEALDSRVRYSKTPDGMGRISDVSYRDDLYEQSSDDDDENGNDS
ncbi:hypothetical protein HED60_14045 [Planctomycetales bacterium ZRK34]|nr:hypothetical protein HED60_14045 [Planctomycetales bacterium ZRK34]